MADNLDNLVNARNGGEGSNEKSFCPRPVAVRLLVREGMVCTSRQYTQRNICTCVVCILSIILARVVCIIFEV